MSSQRNQWGSRIGFILAASGSAVGLGNIWKFPYIAGENGGGFFVLFYLIMIALVGVPLMYSEILIGKVSQANVVQSFRKLKAGPFTITGWLGLITGFVILSFYSVVAGWTLHYLLEQGPAGFSESTEAAGQTFGALLSEPATQTIYHSIFMAITMGIIAAGVNKGIERVAKVLMPMLCAILLGLMVISLTGPGGDEAVDFMFSWKTDKFTAEGALLALGHVFFSLSLGMGAMITYGSYMSRKEQLSRSTLTICIIDTAVALCAGLVLFPIVFGNPPPAEINTTFTLQGNAVTQSHDVVGGRMDVETTDAALAKVLGEGENPSEDSVMGACAQHVEKRGTYVAKTRITAVDGEASAELIGLQRMGPQGPQLYLNTAPAEAIAALPSLDANYAAAIRAHIGDAKKLESLDGLEGVAGIGPAKVKALRETALVNPNFEACVAAAFAAGSWDRPHGEPGAGAGLVFVTLPAKFHDMGFGVPFGMAFFALLFMAALSSAISILEVVVAYAHEKTRMPRPLITAGVGGAIWTVGLLVSLGDSGVKAPETPLGNTWLDILDNLTSVFLLPVGGLLVALFVAFKVSPAVLERAFGEEAKHPIYPIWRFLIRTVAPVGVGVTLLIGIKSLLDKHEMATRGVVTSTGTMVAIGVLLLVGLVMLTAGAHNELLKDQGEFDTHPEDDEAPHT